MLDSRVMANTLFQMESLVKTFINPKRGDEVLTKVSFQISMSTSA